MTEDLTSEDRALLTSLGNALAAARAVPSGFVAAGKASFAWQDLDAELAQLMHDSSLQGSGTRAEEAVVRSMTFTARSLTIELEIGPRGVRGQLVPHQTGTVELELPQGPRHNAAADELGYFEFDHVQLGAFRLHCTTGTCLTISTPWVTL